MKEKNRDQRKNSVIRKFELSEFELTSSYCIFCILFQFFADVDDVDAWMLDVSILLHIGHFVYRNIFCVLFQFFADADDVDAWMLDIFRIVSSEDVGKDEASVQSLLKKHKVGTWNLSVKCWYSYKSDFLCRLRSIAAHRDHFVRRLSVCVCVCLSGSHTFLVVMHSYVSQATHAFLGMLPLCYKYSYSCIIEKNWIHVSFYFCVTCKA